MIVIYRVLIVDDVEILRFDIKRMNVWGEDSGFVIAGEASNGLEAIKMLKSSVYDLVITDIRMPVVDGMELLKAISEENLCPCVVLLSDYTEFGYAREGFTHGAFDYLGKPVDNHSLAELLKRVHTYLEKKKHEQQKLKNWKTLAGEAFFPAADVDKAAELLNQGSKDALKAVEQMVDTVGAAMNYDLIKTSIILKNAVSSILSRVSSEHEWIGRYLDLSDYKKLNLSGVEDWNTANKKVRELIQDLHAFLNKFVIWTNSSNAVKSACLYVLSNVEENISVKNVAEKLFISKAYLSEMFKQSTGVSLLEYITLVKVERAKYLLRTSPFKNYEIAEKLGFHDHEYFSKIFKKHTGYPPAAYRKEIQ